MAQPEGAAGRHQQIRAVLHNINTLNREYVLDQRQGPAHRISTHPRVRPRTVLRIDHVDSDGRTTGYLMTSQLQKWNTHKA